jgi:peptidoglycan/LPS O-acetylase OafA/YrhL
VDYFFVLSGFLITRILLHDRRAGRPLRIFYFRRILRIFPIYYLTCGIVAFLQPPPELPWCFTYLSNFWLSFHQPGILVHTWSLAVEEQFYLFWPLLMRIPKTKLYRVPLLAIGFAVAGAFIYTLGAFPGPANRFLYMGTPFRVLSLALGALIACFESSLFSNPRLVVRLCCAAMIVCSVGGILVKTHPGSTWDDFGRLVSVAALSFATVTGCISIDKTKLSVARVLRSRGLAAIGRISYGVYLYHLPIFVLLGVNTGTGATPTLGHLAIAYVLTFAAAALSYRFIESPILSLKRYITPSSLGMSRAVAVATTQ